MCKNKQLVSLRLEQDLLDWIDSTSKYSSYYDRTAVISRLLQYIKEMTNPYLISKMLDQAYYNNELKQVDICLKE